MPALTENSSAFAALRQRNFGLYVFGSGISLIGMWVQRIAIGWLTWELTHSGTWLGLMAFADLIPVVVLNPFAGYFTDRFNRLRLAKILQLPLDLDSLRSASTEWEHEVSTAIEADEELAEHVRSLEEQYDNALLELDPTEE